MTTSRGRDRGWASGTAVLAEGDGRPGLVRQGLGEGTAVLAERRGRPGADRVPKMDL
ncbi:hypothetical protein BJY16_008004 [Actinoplanes octamycinicus]|uniref:Uncharacterized protein n=1 Tax=Actinoplanes octamycinicus TaxID=135948 RepID=A0A7W7H5S6_9ACTN|nr:hypothetical protein [Actinoplanes octamycinicus]GIE61534.1 hypothetical protein Aoc01nite_69360 [Actinoplanes octamycinicus]